MSGKTKWTTRDPEPIQGQIGSGSTTTLPQPGQVPDIHQNYVAMNNIHLSPSALPSETHNIPTDVQQPAPANQYSGNAQVRESLEGLHSLVQVPTTTAAIVCLTFDQFRDLENASTSSTSRSDRSVDRAVP
ncbi:hypothetical protein QCA50_020529 [Cerrena zonata]|uniref:Uncharacterized protein n=1 Tax=Cerrena zonata TaxID=2478898 RepID=A0AAW0F926_9APHY